MGQKLLKDLPQGVLKNSIGVISVDGSGKGVRIDKSEFLAPANDVVVLFDSTNAVKNATIALSETIENFRFINIYGGDYLEKVRLLSVGIIKRNAKDRYAQTAGHNDRDFMIVGYSTNYSDIIFNSADYTKIQIDNTGAGRGIFRIEGIK